MELLPPVFKKFSTQIWHFLMMPAFFIAFILLYRPFDARTFLDAGRELFSFNLTICTCIILVCMVASRLSFYYIWRKRHISYISYGFYCLAEIFLLSLFCALYIWLISRRVAPYFNVLGNCLQICLMCLIIPYVVLTLVFMLIEAGKRPVEVDNDALVRFTDSQQRLKLVIASSAILFIEAEENYVRIHYLESGLEKEYVLRNSMKTIDELVSRFGLVRSHRSYIVNPAHVKILRKDKEGVILAELDAGTKEIPVSKKFYDRLSSIL